MFYLSCVRKPVACTLSPGEVTVNWSIKSTSTGLFDFNILLVIPLVLLGLCVALPYKHPAHFGISHLASFESIYPIAAMNRALANDMCHNL